MRVGAIDYLTSSDTGGQLGLSIFFQGCDKRCPGCHNPDLQSFDGGQEMDAQQILSEVQKHGRWYDAVALVGGEPLNQDHGQLLSLIHLLTDVGKEVWLYTGREAEEIPDLIQASCSVIVAGSFIQEMATGGFPASSNQIVIDNRREDVLHAVKS